VAVRVTNMAPTNHFKIWKVGSRPVSRGSVTLRGQFDKTNQDAVLETAEWLANPVKKNDEYGRKLELYS
jgi:hypothetical protein